MLVARDPGTGTHLAGVGVERASAAAATAAGFTDRGWISYGLTEEAVATIE